MFLVVAIKDAAIARNAPVTGDRGSANQGRSPNAVEPMTSSAWKRANSTGSGMIGSRRIRSWRFRIIPGTFQVPAS